MALKRYTYKTTLCRDTQCKIFNMLKYVILLTKSWYIVIIRKNCLTINAENMNTIVIITVECYLQVNFK